MSDKVVLPKFDLPGDRVHPAVKVLVAVGTLLVLSMAAVGGAVWHQRSLQLQAEARQQAIITARTAEANAKIEESKARAAEAAAKVAAEQARAAEKLAAKNAPAATATADAGKSAGHHGSGSGHHHGSAKGGSKALATKAGAAGDDKKAAQKVPAGSKRDDAAIDKLLASFK